MDKAGKPQKKKRGVTIIEVARASGVSYSTVSRVLSGYEFVKDDTRNRVMEAVERLGYVANLQARSLAGGRSKIIGLLVPNLDNGYVGTIMRGIDHVLEHANYDLILYTSHRRPGNESVYVSAVANGLSEGLLLIAPMDPTAYVDDLRARNYPYVLIDQADATGKSSIVGATNWQGAYDATRYLNQLGHTQIAFIMGALAMQSAVDRLQGYKAALADCGIPVREEWIIEGDYQQQIAYETTKHLLQSANPRPTAIFGSNDLSAFGAMDAARECGLRIPEDISVIGFDDVPQSSVIYPKLTTICQPLEQMGKDAAKLLLAQIENPNHPPQRVELPTQLIVRDSCGPCHPTG